MTHRHFLVFGTLLAATLGHADSRLTSLRESSEALSGLRGFLEKYIGECGDKQVSAECSSRASAFRKSVNGKRFYLVVEEEAASHILFFNGSRVQITPFLESGGYALTHGPPRKTDSHGNPQLPLLIAKAKAADGDVGGLQRLFATRQVRLEVIFVPQNVWTLPKRGGGKIQGVNAKMEAIQISNVRTGEVLAWWP